jgi:hypothetical protein
MTRERCSVVTGRGSLYQFVGIEHARAITVSTPDRDLAHDRPLDPHLLWCAGPAGYLLRSGYSDVKRAWLRDATGAAVSKDSAGRLILRWTKRVADSAVENIQTLVVDPTLGFVPVRIEAASRLVGSTESKVTALTEIRYANKNGYSIPVSLGIHGNGGLTIKVTCHWVSVNEDIDPKVFTAEGFEASKGTPIFDLRGSQPMFLGFTGTAAPQAPLRSRAAPSSGPAADSILDGVKRTILKEPKYVSSPRYALLVFGAKAESKV